MVRKTQPYIDEWIKEHPEDADIQKVIDNLMKLAERNPENVRRSIIALTRFMNLPVTIR